ncbi:hypothetical protein BDR07DRAFT_1377620 [Suillus spraguei]|nr:hypothetical protein BDR07DRAFT_1377620 [Suillus spraguei]
MSQQLCDDLFTFHMELKKIVIFIAKQLYGIFSKGNLIHKKCISAAVAKLLKTGEYLWLPNSSEVLKEACLSFYYGNSKKALKTKGVLSGFHDSGTDKVPDLTADTCRANFNLLQKSINKLMAIPECCVELEEMLKEWAEEGMIGELRNDLDSAVGSNDNIII